MPLKDVGICWRRLNLPVSFLAWHCSCIYFPLLSLLEYYFACVLGALTKICTGVWICGCRLWSSWALMVSLDFGCLIFPWFPLLKWKQRKSQNSQSWGGSQCSQEHWGKLSSSALAVPLSISAIVAPLQPLLFFSNSGEISVSVFPWSFHRTSQEHLASLFLVTQFH